jgi:hypothetical protein
MSLTKKQILTTTKNTGPITIRRTADTVPQHPEYEAMLPRWVFYLNSYEGGEDYVLNTEYLFTHARETVEDRNYRLRRAVYYNYCRSIVDVYVSHLFKKEIIRESHDAGYHEFLQDIDLRGSSVDSFMAGFVAPMALVFGTVYVLVDVPVVEEELGSSYDETRRGIRPYANMVLPMDLVDWELDRFGQFNWVKIREAVPQRISPLGAREKPRYQYRIWTRHAWYLVNEDREFLNPHGAEGEPHPVGRVPLAVVRNERSFARELVGVSAIADIAPCCRKIYNLASLLDEFLYKQCFSFLAWPGDINTEELGASNIATYDPATKALPAYISPPTDPAAFIESQVDKNIEEIYRLARIRYEGTHPRVAQSGFAKAIDFHDTDNALARKARNFEQAERDIAGLYFRWCRRRNDAQIVYPREFSVKAINDEIEETVRVISLGLSPTLNTCLASRLAKRLLPNLPEEKRREIEKEIETGSKTPPFKAGKDV